MTGAVVIPLCLAAGLVELGRARGGNQLSWGYAVEWPVIAGYGVYLWIKLARERSAAARGGGVRAPSPEPAASPAAIDEADPGLVAWQAYLADLHATDPPGGPPPAGRAGAARRTMHG